MRCFFDGAQQVDWRERLGYLLLTPHYNVKGYCKVDGDNMKTIEKTNNVATQTLSFIFQFLQIKRLGKFLIQSSESYKAKFRVFEAQIHNLPYVNKANPLFYTAAERWAFLDSALNVYEEATHSKDPAWSTKAASKFLRDEILRIKADTEALQAQNYELISAASDKELPSLKHLAGRLNELEDKCEDLIYDDLECRDIEDSDLEDKDNDEVTQSSETIGLSNVGNTCYMNAAVQPLLAIKDFTNLIPQQIFQKAGESIKEFQGRKAILDSFKTFLTAYNDNRPPEVLGNLVGRLRSEIFQAGLLQGGFLEKEQEYMYQDVGSFLELMFFVIGQDFKLSHEKSFPVPNNTNHSCLEILPLGSLLLNGNTGLVQDKIDAFSQPTECQLEKGDAIKHKDFLLTRYTETMKIGSAPPDVLVLRVDKYQVNPNKDHTINCAPLFALGNNVNVPYELTGFAQNFNAKTKESKDANHWTSVVNNDGTWKYCNDDRISVVNPEDQDFQLPATYLIYRKK